MDGQGIPASGIDGSGLCRMELGGCQVACVVCVVSRLLSGRGVVAVVEQQSSSVARLPRYTSELAGGRERERERERGMGSLSLSQL